MAESDSIRYALVPGFPGYRVGDDGSVWYCWANCHRGRIITGRWKRMKPGVQRKRTPGRTYRYVNLTAPGERYRTFRVHRLILEAFVGPCPEGMECRHKDGDPANNRLDNLEWATPERNRQDCREQGRYSETPRNRRFTHEGQTKSLKEWASHFGIPYNCLWHRVNKLGMSFAEAVSRPYKGRSSNGAHWKAAKQARLAGPGAGEPDA